MEDLLKSIKILEEKLGIDHFVISAFYHNIGLMYLE
jgi:hypothetical protein